MQKLYRHFDKDGNLLYVGVSLNALTRLNQHNINSKWAVDIVRIEIESYKTRKEAMIAEAYAIKDESPIYNGIRPSVKKVENQKYPEREKSEVEKSKDSIFKGIVQFDPVYSIHETAKLLKTSEFQIKKWIYAGWFGCIETSRKKRKDGIVQIGRKITGWQIIDFIENWQNGIIGND